MSVQINFNGKSYTSIEEMPPEARQAYQQAMALLADQNANGLPDFLDGLMQGQSLDTLVEPLNVLAASQSQIIINGQTYASPNEMPIEARQAYQQAMGNLDANANGLPDALEAIGFKAGAANPSVGPRPAPAPPMAHPYAPAGVESDDPAANAASKRRAAYVVLALAALIVVAVMAFVLLSAGPAIIGPN